MLDDTLALVFSSQWIVFLSISGILIVISELCFLVGRGVKRKTPDLADSPIGSVQGAILALLGLLLGFSFAMAVGRYDVRRNLAVDEANSIGTTWLRAEFLSGKSGLEVRTILKDYTKLRIESIAALPKSPEMDSLIRRNGEFETRMWEIARREAASNPSPVTVSFITSLNETFDLGSSRIYAARNHVPGAVWLLLIVVAGCGAGGSGYFQGLSMSRSSLNQLVFPVLIAVVITLISDMDRAKHGLIGVSQEPLTDLYETISKETP